MVGSRPQGMEGEHPVIGATRSGGLQAVVLAGGLATRMRPRTLTVPKSMLEVAGRPFVDWQLEKLAACGFDDIVMCVAHLADPIERHVGDGARYDVRVRYVNEGERLLGTAGAIRNALPMLAPAFLVTYGDSYLPFDYAAPLRALAEHDDCEGVMSVFKNEGKWDPSNVVVGHDASGDAWVVRYEKGVKDPAFDHIDYGAIALRRDVIARIPEGEVIGLDVIQRDLAQRKKLRALAAHARFFEIGSPDGLATLEKHLSTHAS